MVVSAAGEKGKKVRELWVGNLPEDIIDRVLYSHFFIYGEIESVEILSSNKTWGFVRYMLVNCASRACEHTNGMDLQGNKIKVIFSDPQRRGEEIIGDKEGYQLNEFNCKTLFVAFCVNTDLPPQTKFEEIFGRFGRIKAIYMKQTTHNTQYRPHAFIDY